MAALVPNEGRPIRRESDCLRSRGVVEAPHDAGDEDVGIDRLPQHARDSAVIEPGRIASGDDDDRDVAGVGARGELALDVPAVEHRQPEVEDDDRRGGGVDPAQRLEAVTDRCDAQAGRLEPEREQIARGAIVFDQQERVDGWPRGHEGTL